MDSSGEQREIWDRIAADWSPDEAVETESTAPMIDFLAQLAGDGQALEFAVGAGRIAVPLARRGVPVAGIDVSPAMVEVLHAAMPAAELPVTVGSMATADAPGRDYQLVYLVANAISCLLHQDEQIACFQNAARHLRPGGHFVIQVWVPQLRQLPPGQTVVPAAIRDDLLIFDSYDLVTQRLLCTATSGPPRWTSWPSWPGSTWWTATPDGTDPSSPATATQACPYGRSRTSREAASVTMNTNRA
jgi:SAM-dependent methyltransferase